jgi:hypothetical protein
MICVALLPSRPGENSKSVGSRPENTCAHVDFSTQQSLGRSQAGFAVSKNCLQNFRAFTCVFSAAAQGLGRNNNTAI